MLLIFLAGCTSGSMSEISGDAVALDTGACGTDSYEGKSECIKGTYWLCSDGSWSPDHSKDNLCGDSSASKITGAVTAVNELGSCSDSNLWEDKCVGTHMYTCSGTDGAWVDVGEDLGYCPGGSQ